MGVSEVQAVSSMWSGCWRLVDFPWYDRYNRTTL